jgi:hypothetical protein
VTRWRQKSTLPTEITVRGVECQTVVLRGGITPEYHRCDNATESRLSQDSLFAGVMMFINSQHYYDVYIGPVSYDVILRSLLTDSPTRRMKPTSFVAAASFSKVLGLEHVRFGYTTLY